MQFSAFMRPFVAQGEQGVFDFFQLFTNLGHDADSMNGYFFLLDFAFMYFAFFVWTILEQGWSNGMILLFWTLLIGPAAAMTRQASIREEMFLLEQNLKKE